ncbi:MAG: hypothetical protein AAF447_12250 [Myxococcota bacterium]
MRRPLVAALVLSALASCDSAPALPSRVAAALAGAGDVLALGRTNWGAPEGVRWRRPSGDLVEALALPPDVPGGATLVRVLREAGIGAVLAETGAQGAGETLGAAMAALRHVPGLRGRVLGPRVALYAPAEFSAEDPSAGAALARVARRILAGDAPPRISRFPERFRRLRGSVEVMVLLRSYGRARLWRSARGNSIGRALSTAALVARRRWAERENAMGGALAEKLPRLDVEVSLLAEDGTFDGPTPALLDRAVRRVHGVGYDRPGAWRYLLPEATAERGEGSGARAFEALLADNDLPAEALGRDDLRFYRFVLQPLGTSAAPGTVSPRADPLDAAAALDAIAP